MHLPAGKAWSNGFCDNVSIKPGKAIFWKQTNVQVRAFNIDGFGGDGAMILLKVDKCFKDTVESGQVLQANGIDVFEFTFNANGKNNMNIKISLHAEGNEWRVSLHQYNIPIDEYNIPIDEESKTMYHVGCGEGWTFYLTNLKSVMEGGIDLRNKDEKVKKVINK